MRSCKHCGGELPDDATSRRLFCSPVCRATAARERQRDDSDAEAPVAVPGRCRGGLEAWLETIEDELPASLTEAARALSDEVDSAPRNSPLWGRYLGVLELLEAAREDIDAEADRMSYEFSRQLAHLVDVDRFRAQKYAEAKTDEERRRWEKLVPIGCAQHEHNLHTWPAGRVACLDCGAEAGSLV